VGAHLAPAWRRFENGLECIGINNDVDGGRPVSVVGSEGVLCVEPRRAAVDASRENDIGYDSSQTTTAACAPWNHVVARILSLGLWLKEPVV
jgi:hypothetical protein